MTKAVTLAVLLVLAGCSSSSECPGAPSAGCTVTTPTVSIRHGDGRAFVVGERLAFQAQGQTTTCVFDAPTGKTIVDCPAPPPTMGQPDFNVRLIDASTVSVTPGTATTFTVTATDTAGDVVATQDVVPARDRCGCNFEDTTVTIP